MTLGLSFLNQSIKSLWFLGEKSICRASKLQNFVIVHLAIINKHLFVLAHSCYKQAMFLQVSKKLSLLFLRVRSLTEVLKRTYHPQIIQPAGFQTHNKMNSKEFILRVDGICLTHKRVQTHHKNKKTLPNS